ncbi:MAG: hypothetical protein ACTSX2_01310 [Candidatus Thorarchaeota archaeon]
MEAEFQTLFNIATTIIAFGLGFVVNRVFNKMDALTAQDALLTKEIYGIKIALPTNYVTKPQLDQMANAIFKKLDTISNKLDMKADKL